MSTSYNQVAGQSIERLAALSDGIFAVAMTLMVFDLRVPSSSAIRSEPELWRGLVALAPQLIVYAMSFLTLGIYWTGQQTQLNHLRHSDRHLGWLHIGFLFAVSVVPFATRLIAEFITFRLALLVYWANILALGISLLVCWRYAARAGLVKVEALPDIGSALERRILIAQALYALAALLCVVNTYLSIAAIVAIQLWYAVAPRIRG